MTATNILQRNGRPMLRDAATHPLNVGQAVRVKGGYRRSAVPVYHITGTLPPSGGRRNIAFEMTTNIMNG